MKHFKKLLAVVLTFVFVVTALAVEAPTEVYAAKTTTITMVKGEKFSFSADTYNVKSCSSSKKSVVTVKKNQDESTEVILTAKEKGTSNVTIKTQRGTKKYTIKVVGNSIKIKAVAQAGSYLIYQITNNTSVTFESLYFDWTAKDADGDVLKESGGYDYVKYLTAKSTAYVSVYIGYGNTASLKKSTAKANLTDHKRYPQYKYTDQASKVKVTVTSTVDGSSVDFKVKFKNKVNEYVYADADLVLYDSEDEIISVINVPGSLGKKETTTKKASLLYGADVYDHYEVVVRAYSSVYSN
jgi:hypothetical protein